MGLEAMQSVTDRPRELVIGSHPNETRQVLVTVTDSGAGISVENADRLFNAFFTTKSIGVWDYYLPFDPSSPGDGSRANNVGRC